MKTLTVEVISRLTRSGKLPHQLVKEYIAFKLQTSEFDRCLDKALVIGGEQGTDVYDECIDLILKSVDIPESEILEMLEREYI